MFVEEMLECRNDMKKNRLIKVVGLLAAVLLPLGAGAAEAQDTLHVSEFGIRPYTYENSVPAMRKAIEACRERGARVLAFEPGRYDFWPEGAVRKEYFVSNTSSETECPSKVKTVGLLFEDMEDLTVEGNGATLMFHGRMTMIALDHCREVKLRNLHLDFERPGGSELTYTRVFGTDSVEVAFHPDTRYDVADGRIHLYGEGWRSNKNHCIQYDAETGHFFYCKDWQVLEASRTWEVKLGVVRFAIPSGVTPKVGNTLTVRDIIRDQTGMLIYESRDITLERVGVHYMHGLGIVSQYTRNVTMDGVQCTPSEGSARLLASSADFMHFSGCSGKVRVIGCHFAGAQDDPINVHGTNLRAVEQVDEYTLRLRFMHPQSYGYNAYFVGDTVAFVKASTMERFARARVVSVGRVSDRVVEVAFNRRIPNQLEVGKDCVENLTCTPEVEIRDCHFTRTSTRGTLVTTPRRVVIAGNTYDKTGMSAILIEGDAAGWYESGPVEDVLITGNTFVDCAYSGGPAHAVIAMNPSNTVVDAQRPVHRNIRILGNTFLTHGNPVLFAKSTADLLFEDNKVSLLPESPAPSTNPLFILKGCKGVIIRKNAIHIPDISRSSIVWQDMKRGYVKTDLK